MTTLEIPSRNLGAPKAFLYTESGHDFISGELDYDDALGSPLSTCRTCRTKCRTCAKCWLQIWLMPEKDAVGPLLDWGLECVHSRNVIHRDVHHSDFQRKVSCFSFPGKGARPDRFRKPGRCFSNPSSMNFLCWGETWQFFTWTRATCQSGRTVKSHLLALKYTGCWSTWCSGA